jgi:GLPGLI family protein
MKKILFALLVISTAVNAQVKEGKVVYERKTNLWKNLPPEADQMKSFIPEFNTSNLELYFNGSQSLFKPVAQEAPTLPTADGPGGGGGPRRVFTFGAGGAAGGDAETFKDYETGLFTETRELGPKQYLISDSLKALKWKITPDTMTINGILCTKATTTIEVPKRSFSFRGAGGGNGARTRPAPEMEKQPVIAWFAMDIPSQAGPDNYFGLPGLIMMVDVNNGTTVIKATSIEPIGKVTIKAPTKGKAITREEYRKLLQNQQGGGGFGGAGQRVEIRM